MEKVTEQGKDEDKGKRGNVDGARTKRMVNVMQETGK